MNHDSKVLYRFLLQQLASESYLEGVDPQREEEIRTALQRGNNRLDADLPNGGLTRFTKAQATEFLRDYRVIHHLSDNPTDGQAETFNGIALNTGFSATLIRDKTTGQYTLAIRSTEYKPWSAGGDRERDAYGADLALLTGGFALAQIDTMEKYYAWLKSSGTLPPNAQLNVTGYSLGGHLATVFTELHRTDTDVRLQETVTFNAPGRGTWDLSKGSLSDLLTFYRAVLANPAASVPQPGTAAFVKYIAAVATSGPLNGLSLYLDPRYLWAQAATEVAFGTTGLYALPSNPGRTALTNGAEALITAVYGREYPSDQSTASNRGVHGPARSVFIEAQPSVAGLPDLFGGTGDFGGGHSIVLVADSLALMRAMNQLDSAQTIDSLGEIFVRASSIVPQSTVLGDGSDARAEFDTLENSLDALRRTLLGSDLARTPYATGGRGFGDIAARDGWYTNLLALTTSATFLSLIDKVRIVPVASSGAATLGTSAKSDFGDWMALRTLSPFVLKANATPTAAEALAAAWQAGNTIDYNAWQADAALTVQQRLDGAAAFSEGWYADRAALLQWLLKANEQNIDHAQNNGRITGQPLAQPMQFCDLQSQLVFTVSQQALSQDALGVTRVIFGRNDAPDDIVGADAKDRLYGGGGADSIDGREGDDYVEGNAGDDDLRGGAGADILVGGAGVDTLRGGTGNDRLLGGTGSDRYHFTGADGIDSIVDVDGLGQVTWDGESLVGGLRLGGGSSLWRSADDRFTYSLNEVGRPTLYITKAGSSGTLVIENFSRSRNDLSIVLADSPLVQPPPVTVRDIIGDRVYADSDPVAPGLQVTYDDLGNTVRTAAPNPGFADFFADSAGNDRIRSGGGADFIGYSRGGSDDVDAGDGNDGVSSGDGNDWIDGGAGADELAGGNGSDRLFGGADDDVIMTEHEIAYDSSTYRIVVPPGASVIRNWTYDGRFAEAGYGIQIVQYTFEGITFQSPWVGIGGYAERRDPTARDFVDAGDGSDLVYGGYGSDTILGGAGSDRLEGSGGNDVIEGGSGNDVIAGDAPVSTAVSTTPISLHGDDQLLGGSGDDLLFGGSGGDALDGGEGNDVLFGDASGLKQDMPGGTLFIEFSGTGADTLRGGAGNDRLRGEGGDDILIGGTGDDTLWGDTGANVYRFDRGDGKDSIFIQSIGSSDELHFGPGIQAAEVTLRQVGADLQIDTSAAIDSVRVSDWFKSVMAQQLAAIRFADGTVWTREQINDRFVVQGSGSEQNDNLTGWEGRDQIEGLGGDDRLSGAGGSDQLVGGRGNDEVDGGAGNDRYVFRIGDGTDRITALDLAGDDVLQLTGMRRNDVAFTRSADSLVIGTIGTTDRITIDRYFEGEGAGSDRSSSGVQAIEFDDVRLSVADVRAMFQVPVSGTPGADYLWGASTSEIIMGGAGNDTLLGAGGDDTLLGGDGNDSLDGGLGVDRFDGGPGDDVLSSLATTNNHFVPINNGDDTFVFGRGYGHDVAQDFNPVTTPSTDRIVLKDLLPGDVALGRGDSGTMVSLSGDTDLLIRVPGSDEHLRVLNFFDADPHFWIERLEFADGSIWGREEVLANLSADSSAPTAGRDFLLAGPGSDSINGQSGNDVLWLGEGNDVGEGGEGDDHLQGGSGSDYLSGGAGNDELLGGIGADVLDGGAGDDYLIGGIGPFVTDAASDTYLFRRGGGRDTVVHTGSAGAADTVFLVDLAPADVELGWTVSNELRVRILGTDDLLFVQKQFDASAQGKIDAIRFGDGTVFDAATIDNLARQNRDDFMNGSSSADVLDGGAGNDDLRGGAGNDTLLGGSGDDRLDGETGADAMHGGPGNDFFVVDNAGDTVIEASGAGTDSISASVSYTLPQEVENLSLSGVAGALNATGNALANRMTGNTYANRLEGGAGNDVLDGGTNRDTMLGGAGDDTYYVDNASDTVTENTNEGTDLVVSSVSRTLGSNQEHLTLSGTAAISATGNTGSNYLSGNSGDNALNGAGGTDVLQGAAGNDSLTDTSGRGLLDGGDGADVLIAGTDRQFVAGGAGNDALTLGGGADVVAFNRGHGADTINTPASGAGLGEKNDVVSLSGIAYGDLRLSRESSDLVLKVAGTSDSIRVKGWYVSAGNQTINTLQFLVDSTAAYDAASVDPLRNKRVVQLDFTKVATAFAAAGSPADWAISPSALSAAYVSGSNADALGGQVAYRYGRDGNLAGLEFAAAVAVLGDAAFGTATQSIGVAPTNGGVRLARTGDPATAMRAELDLVNEGGSPGKSPEPDGLLSGGDADPLAKGRPVEWTMPVDGHEDGEQRRRTGLQPYLSPAHLETLLQGIDFGPPMDGIGLSVARAVARQWTFVSEMAFARRANGAAAILGEAPILDWRPEPALLLAPAENGAGFGRGQRLMPQR